MRRCVGLCGDLRGAAGRSCRKSLGGNRKPDQRGEAVSKILLPIGELMILLGLWVALWNIRNEFLLWLLGAGLFFLGVGMALE